MKIYNGRNKMKNLRKFQEYKKESQNKKYDLMNQLSIMRKNYNKKLNEISEKLISEQFLCIDKPKQLNRIKKISIQALDDEQLLKDLKQLIAKENEKEIVSFNYALTNQKNKDSIFQKEIQFHLDSLKLYDQQDIQQSLDILKGFSVEKNLILQLSKIIEQIQKGSQKDENHKKQINFINEIQEFVDQAKQCQLQLNILDQTTSNYLSHIQKIQQTLQNNELKSHDDKQNISEYLKSQYSNISNILNEYSVIFENNNQQLKKFCNIHLMENDLIKLTETNKNLQIQQNNQINQLQKTYDYQLIQLNEKIEQQEKQLQHLKEQFDKATQENNSQKEQSEYEKQLIIKKSEDEQNKLKCDYTQIISQKNSELQELFNKLEQIKKYQLEQQEFQKMELKSVNFFTIYFIIFRSKNIIRHQLFLIFINIIIVKQVKGGKLVAEVKNSAYCFCICEQAIPITGKIQITFQILSGSDFFVGIGFRDIMNNNNFLNCYNAESGTYLILNNGYTYSHHNKNVHNKELSFKFTKNDIIRMQIFKINILNGEEKKNSQATFLMDINTTQDLYPCVGFGEKSTIKILDCEIV